MSVVLSHRHTMARPAVSSALLPIMLVVFIAFLIIGMALPVLPLHVHQRLGLSTFVVGLVTGSQFVAAFISRVWAGHYADSRGAKRAVMAGLSAAVAGGLLYLVSLRFVGEADVAATTLLIGRALLGAAESFIITGGVTWGMALAGPAFIPVSGSKRYGGPRLKAAVSRWALTRPSSMWRLVSAARH